MFVCLIVCLEPTHMAAAATLSNFQTVTFETNFPHTLGSGICFCVAVRVAVVMQDHEIGIRILEST